MHLGVLRLYGISSVMLNLQPVGQIAPAEMWSSSPQDSPQVWESHDVVTAFIVALLVPNFPACGDPHEPDDVG